MTLVLSMMQRGHVALHIPESGIEEDPRLEAGESGVVLDEEPLRVGEDQARALSLDQLVPYHYLMRRGIVLHLFAGTEGIGAGALMPILPEIEIPHDPREGAVGDMVALAIQDLPDSHGVARCDGEGLTDGGREVLVAGSSVRYLPRPPYHPLDGVPGYFEDLPDLSERDAPLAQ